KPQSNSHHGSGNGSATAVVVPLAVPLVLAQPPVNIAAAGAKSTALPATPPTPTPTTAAPAAAPEGPGLASIALDAATSIGFSLTAPGAAITAAKLLGAAVDAATATGTSPAPSPAATPAAASTTADGPALPGMAATLSLRLAAAANNLVSQPRAALASVAPDKVSAPPAGDAAPTTASAPAVAAGKPALAAASSIGAELLAAAKDPSVIPAQLPVPAPTARPAATADGSISNADSSTSDPGADAATQAAALVPTQTQSASTDTIATQALPIMSHAAAEQVAVSLRQAVSNGDDHIQIQLQPADLGAVAVKLSINHDGRVTMVVSADRSDTLNLLQQDSGSLTQALRDAGLSADSSSLSFNLRGGFQSNQQSAGGNSAGGSSSADAIDATTAAPLPAARFSTHSGSLDIHV
ncbi:MAG TPA: flagellar hook-length control protein FliK, partial [Stellaceae bacterium]|nr:flagellar hook-length control protein FliK [Stellaceae bacterium]